VLPNVLTARKIEKGKLARSILALTKCLSAQGDFVTLLQLDGFPNQFADTDFGSGQISHDRHLPIYGPRRLPQIPGHFPMAGETTVGEVEASRVQAGACVAFINFMLTLLSRPGISTTRQ